MRITFKKNPPQQGLLSVGAGLRGSEIRIDGVRVGSVDAHSRGNMRPGWYFYVHSNGLFEGSPFINTCNAPHASESEARAAAKEWILAQMNTKKASRG